MYELRAFIVKAEVLVRQIANIRNARLVPLKQGMAMIPLTDDLFDEFGDEDTIGRFEWLTPDVEQWGQSISAAAPIAYIEAYFFGGLGGQSAIIWHEGTPVLGPIHARHAINQVLRYFGVQTGRAHDEFDAMGLGQNRRTSDWIG